MIARKGIYMFKKREITKEVRFEIVDRELVFINDIPFYRYFLKSESEGLSIYTKLEPANTNTEFSLKRFIPSDEEVEKYASEGSNKIFTCYVDATVVYQSSIWNKKIISVFIEGVDIFDKEHELKIFSW